VRKNYVPEIVIEPPLEDDSDAAGWHPEDHFCSNCPEYIDWEWWKNQEKVDSGLVSIRLEE